MGRAGRRQAARRIARRRHKLTHRGDRLPGQIWKADGSILQADWRSRSAIGRASCSRPRMDRANCPGRYKGSGWHPLQVYRAIIDLANRFSKVTDWRDPHDGCMPIPPPPTTLAGRDRWTMAGRQLSPYRSRASPRRKLPAFKTFALPTVIARTRASEPHYYRTIVLHVCHERLAQKPVILNAPPLLGGPSMSRLSRTRF
jgi:hypothetical protein